MLAQAQPPSKYSRARSRSSPVKPPGMIPASDTIVRTNAFAASPGFLGARVSFRTGRGELDESAFGERDVLPLADDEDLDEGQGCDELTGEDLVGLARLRDTGRMVVREDNGDRVMVECAPHDFAHVDGRAVDGSGEELFSYAMTRWRLSRKSAEKISFGRWRSLAVKKRAICDTL